jgi:hypothetical protein
VDDLLIAAQDAEAILKFLKSKFTIKGGDLPTDYLGLTMRVTPDKEGWGLYTKPYLEQCLENVRNITGQTKLSRQSTPALSDWHPETYDDTLLEPKQVHDYRSMIGMAHWLVALGRIDIHHPVATLARFSHVATKKHFSDLVRVFEFLNKYPDRHLEVRNTTIDISEYEKGIDFKKIMEGMKLYYPDAVDHWDPEWPLQLGDLVYVIIFVDADFATDHLTRKSKTGILEFIGSNLYKSISKLQSTIADSTYSAEIIAMGTAVDEAKNLLYTMRSLGVRVHLPISIMSDSKSAVDNVTIPGSPLKKKNEAICYHKIREGIALGLWRVMHIDGTQNPSDINTKVVTRATLVQHASSVMCGQSLH